jgi:hypothetical protein
VGNKNFIWFKRETLKAKWTCFIILICIHELKVDIWINSWIKLVLQNRQNVNKASCLDLFIYCVHEIIQLGYIFLNMTHLYISDSWIIKITFLIIVNYNHFENYNILLSIVFFRHLTLSASKMPNVNKASEGAYCISWFAHFWAMTCLLYHTLYPKDFTDLIPKS